MPRGLLLTVANSGLFRWTSSRTPPLTLTQKRLLSTPNRPQGLSGDDTFELTKDEQLLLDQGKLEELSVLLKERLEEKPNVVKIDEHGRRVEEPKWWEVIDGRTAGYALLFLAVASTFRLAVQKTAIDRERAQTDALISEREQALAVTGETEDVAAIDAETIRLRSELHVARALLLDGVPTLANRVAGWWNRNRTADLVAADIEHAFSLAREQSAAAAAHSTESVSIPEPLPQKVSVSMV